MAASDHISENAAAHFEETAGHYESVARDRPEFAERFAKFKRGIDAAWERAGTTSPVAIDLGCGAGDLTWYLAAKGFQTVGVDGSPAMLARARRQAEARGVTGITFLQRDLPLSEASEVAPPGSASLVVASSVIEYVDRDQEVLEQCRRLLGPHGQALISFPNRRSIYWALQRRLRETRRFREADSYHQRHQYDPESVEAAARRAGLRVCDVQYFALPLQRKLPGSLRFRPPWAAMMFLATLSPASDVAASG